MPIRTPQNTAVDWINTFNKEFSTWLDSFNAIGQLQYLEISEVKTMFKDSSWYGYENHCPYLNRIAGYITWEWWTYDEYKLEDKKSVVLEWMAFSNGYIVRLDDNHIFDPVKILKYPLSDIQSSYGFEQGQIFLKNVTNNYFEDLKTKVLEKLRKKGIIYQFSKNRTTGRNELYVSKTISEENLVDETLELWGFDVRATQGNCWETFLTR